MIKQFKPTWMVSAVYRLTPAALKSQGVRAVLADLDNTLIAWNNPDGTPELKQWLTELNAAGITLMVVSNNSHQRVQHAVAPLGLPFVSRALKPLPFGIKRAISRLGLTRDEVVMVGDQYLTDMAAAHASGVRSILVRPLIKSDAWNTKINRFLERFVKWQLKRKYPNLDFQEELK